MHGVIFEDLVSGLLEFGQDVVPDRRQIEDNLHELSIGVFDCEIRDEGAQQINSDDADVENDELFEVVVIIEPRPEVKQLLIGLLLETIVLHEQQTQIPMDFLSHS
jgi:hypothetical protein